MIIPLPKDCISPLAGIRSLYLIPCHRFQGATFNSEGEISEIQLECLGGQGWIEYRFRRLTASFDQTLTRSGMNTPTTQVISFQSEGLVPEARRSIVSLKKQCCVVAVVKDGGGRYMLAGVSSYMDGVETREMKLASLNKE